MKNILGILSALLSGILLYLSFPPFGFFFLAWFSFVPLFLSLIFSRYLQAFFLVFLTGAVFGVLSTLWLKEVPGMPLVSFIAIVLYFSMFLGLFGFLFKFIERRTIFPKVIVAPVLWVAVEYLRANLFFLALPWLLIGHSQYENIPIIQIASFTSVYGISFLVILLNAALAEGIIFLINQYKDKRIQQKYIKYGLIKNIEKGNPPIPPLEKGGEGGFAKIVLYSLFGAFILILIVHLWGEYQVRTLGKNTKDMLTVSLIQGNIPQNEKWDERFRKKVMDRYKELTLQSSNEKPDLIVWPETATPGYVIKDREIDRFVKNLINQTETPLLFGSSTVAKVVHEGRKFKKERNSAFLMNSEGKIKGTYTKMRLLPFSEYIPLEGKFRWPRWLVPVQGFCVPGNSPTVFEFSGRKFGVVICWENIFSEHFRTFVRKGSQFMFNLTNEAWFGESSASSQILSMSVFRAVENRVSLLRCANTGITCIVDPFGRVLGKVMDERGKDIMVTGILTTTVPGLEGTTFYTKYGDIFAIICCIIAAMFIILAMLPVRVRRYLRISGTN